MRCPFATERQRTTPRSHIRSGSALPSMTKPNRRTLSSTNLSTQMLRAVCGSGFNQLETLASSVLKKQADTSGSSADKIG